MNPAAIAIVSLFAGVVLVVIVAGLATLIYLHIQLRKEIDAASAEYQESTEWLRKMAGDLVGEVTESVNGARTSFTGIRADVKTSLESHNNQVADVLARHQKAFEETVGKVNGAALEAACMRSIKAAAQIVAVATDLKQLLYAAEGGLERTEVPLAPEEYAPEETIYAVKSPTARMDAESEAADAIEGVSAYAEA